MKRNTSLVLASVLLLAGCGGGQAEQQQSGGVPRGGKTARVNYALAEPVYPDFPQQPVMPLEGPEGAWEAYSEAYDRYIDALRAIRGDSPDLPQGTARAVNVFAAPAHRGLRHGPGPALPVCHPSGGRAPVRGSGESAVRAGFPLDFSPAR